MRAWCVGLLCCWGLVLGCDSSNPVAPPPPGGGGSTFLLSLSSQQSTLTAGSSTGVTITVSAARADSGAPPADGTEVTVNTNLGNFGLDSGGDPLQTTTAALRGGSAEVVFFAGTTPGTANILAQLGDTGASLNIAIADPGDPPVAAFSFTTNGLEALFADGSTGSPTSWRWDFGDGATGSEQNPDHTYAAAGTYTVELTVTNAAGSSNIRKFVPVSPVANPLQPSFTVTTSGLTAIFTDTSEGSPTTWVWEFGDQSTNSTLQNPTHTYSAGGTYPVTLTIGNAIGQGASAGMFVTVSPPGTAPAASFTVTLDGLTAIFVDTSTGSDLSWSWDFDDGGTSTDQNPTHTYSAAGSYRVTLAVTNSLGSDQTSQVITVPPPGTLPTAGFTFDVNDLDVAFTDTSTGSPTSWSWDFGDGDSSTAQNPVHSYEDPGTYTVTLTAANSSGSSSTSQFVEVVGPLAAAFSYDSMGTLTVQFTDESTGAPTSWEWDFGDGGTSTQQNPSHTYAAAGPYEVTLTVRADGESDLVRVTITVPGSGCPISPCPP